MLHNGPMSRPSPAHPADVDVLVVEDEDDLRTNTLDYLAAFDISGAGAGSAEEARRWLDERGARVLVLDINLPGDSGYDLCRDVRRHHQTPIIFCSARSGDDDQILALGLGGDDYLRKPYSLGVLTARIRRTLERLDAAGEPSPAQGYDDGHLRFDPVADRFWVDGADLRLTAMEHRLLRHLVQHRERAISKQELFEQVWGEAITGDGTLSVHVRRLRTAIEPDPAEPRYIQTLWGRGYLFRDLAAGAAG